MSNAEFNFKMNLIKASQCLGEDFYTGTIKLKHLLENDFFLVPVYRSGTSITDENSGYQREAKQARINAIAERVKKKDFEVMNEPFVDNINLNLRSSHIKQYVTPVNKDKESFGDMFEFKYISKLGKFYVIDGQTRIRGAQAAYNDAKLHGDYELKSRIENIQVQVSLSFIDNVYKEAYLFYLINNYSKSIPADGAIRLLNEGAINGNVHFTNEITMQNKKDEVQAYQIATRLNEESSIWSGQMRDFNDEGKGLGTKTTIRAVSRMLLPIIKTISTQYEDVKDSQVQKSVYEITEAFWSGFKNAFPKMFNEPTAEDYSVLKAGPAEIMMKVLNAIIKAKKHHSDKIGDLTEKRTYYELLEKMRTLSDVNPNNNKITGSDIFLSGKAGAIGKYSNNAAKNAMAQNIVAQIMEWTKLVN